MGENMGPADIAAVTNHGGYGYGYDGGWGGGWWGMLILFALLGGGGFGWGNRGWGANWGGCDGQPVTEAGLCNAMNFNNLENAVGRLSDNQAAIARQTDNAICQLGYQSLDHFGQLTQAVQDGFNQTQAQLAQCCCDIGRGIDSVNYNAAMNTAAINANTTAQTQRILDQLSENRMADMQNRINQLELQSQLCGVVRYPMGYTYTAGNSPFCGCNAGCGCGNI